MDEQSHQSEATARSLAQLGLPPEALPRHIAVIMDGNGRWAQARGKPRIIGHQHGAQAVRAIVTECAQLARDQFQNGAGIEVLTLYSFSIENWKRPPEEIEFLMSLYVEYLKLERKTMMDNNVRFVQIGRREGLPQPVLDEIDRTLEETRDNTGLILALAINYGSRAEITDAVRNIAREVEAGRLQSASITEEAIASHLYTAGLPDPDLLIRTAGEMRLSNYLLWQISYAELYVSEQCWPDFDVAELHQAIRAFASRKRTFGAVL